MSRPVNENSLGDMIQKITGFYDNSLRLSLINNYLKKGVFPEKMIIKKENTEGQEYQYNYYLSDDALIFLKNLIILDKVFKPRMVKAIIHKQINESEIQKLIGKTKEESDAQNELLIRFSNPELIKILSEDLTKTDLSQLFGLKIRPIQEESLNDLAEENAYEVLDYLYKKNFNLAEDSLSDSLYEFYEIEDVFFLEKGCFEQVKIIQNPFIAYALAVFYLEWLKKERENTPHEKNLIQDENLYHSAFLLLLSAYKTFQTNEVKTYEKQIKEKILTLAYRYSQPKSLKKEYLERGGYYPFYSNLRKRFLIKKCRQKLTPLYFSTENTPILLETATAEFQISPNPVSESFYSPHSAYRWIDKTKKTLICLKIIQFIDPDKFKSFFLAFFEVLKTAPIDLALFFLTPGSKTSYYPVLKSMVLENLESSSRCLFLNTLRQRLKNFRKQAGWFQKIKLSLESRYLDLIDFLWNKKIKSLLKLIFLHPAYLIFSLIESLIDECTEIARGRLFKIFKIPLILFEFPFQVLFYTLSPEMDFLDKDLRDELQKE